MTPTEDATRRVMIVGDLPSDTRQRVTDLLASQGIVVIAETRAESLIDQFRAALAEVDRLTAELAWQEERHGTRAEQEVEETEWDAEWAEIQAMSAEDLDASLRAAGVDPEEGRERSSAFIRLCVERVALAAKVDRLTAERDKLAAEFSAYADLPPEPEPSPMAAFFAVLATDNHPDDADGGGDCDGLR